MLDLIPAGNERGDAPPLPAGTKIRWASDPAHGPVGEIERVLNDTRAVTPSEDPQDERPVHVTGAGSGDVVASDLASSDSVTDSAPEPGTRRRGDEPLHVTGAASGDVVASAVDPASASETTQTQTTLIAEDPEPIEPQSPTEIVGRAAEIEPEHATGPVEPAPATSGPETSEIPTNDMPGATNVALRDETVDDQPAPVAAEPDATGLPAASIGVAAAETAPLEAAEGDADTDIDPDEEFEDEPDETPEPARLRFADLGLSEELVRAVEEKGYLHPTPIQEQAIPYVLMGRDVLGVAQTGTGKTAGFTLPLLDILSGSRARARMPRSLILEPTRELALQVAENFVDYGRYLKLNHALLIGGESMSDQKEALAKGVDVLIATPGRLLDLFERGGLMLNDTKILVIDEADRMLDMGFIPDVERIASLISAQRQTLFFSATMAPEIKRLADAFLQNPKLITVSRAASVASTIEAGLALVDEAEKRRALRSLLNTQDVTNALIFCNRKRDVDILAKSLAKHNFSVGALHGDLPQSVRFSTLEGFKAGDIRLLVCSDVAARGIDIGGLSHVFNFDVPIHAEDYVHRIGRTGRAGRTGHAYTIAVPDDRLLVDAIEKLTGAPIPRMSVPDVATASWSEIDGRKRRGRRGGKPAARPTAEPVAKAPSREPRPKASPPAIAPTPSAAAPAPIATRERDRDRPRDRDRERDREPIRDREPRRDYPRRQEDLGPPVLAFGDATPDFMLLPRRLAAVTTDQDLLETDEFDLPDEPPSPAAASPIETIDEAADQVTEDVAPSHED
jgi:superfamily II DNA/RNA helicase